MQALSVYLVYPYTVLQLMLAAVNTFNMVVLQLEMYINRKMSLKQHRPHDHSTQNATIWILVIQVS